MTRRYPDISDRTRASIRAHYEKENVEAGEIGRLRDQVAQAEKTVAHVRAVLGCGLEDRLKVTSLTIYLDALEQEAS